MPDPHPSPPAPPPRTALGTTALLVGLLGGCAVLAAVSGFEVAKPALAQQAAPNQPGDSPVSFNRDVRPLLSDNCFACHGPDPETRASGLRLDLREEAVAFAGAEGRALVPGDAAASAVIQRIRSTDADTVMPPPETHKTLTPEQADLLARWIDQGAVYEPHWAYVAPQRPALPEVHQAQWAVNAVDRFVLNRLEAEGLAPSDRADPATLLRRVTRDLTGLPPTTDELDAFLADPSDAAYAQVVERLLASPAFGERMAIAWLDLVRYADSTGFHSDETQPVWAYRDYVVQAFNDNTRFDQFTREQLAGDLLPTPGVREKTASGFNRLNLTTGEAGAQPAEYTAKYMADRVRAVSTVWMGATVGCAECHDHKYDPYTARDFYRMGAFFADIEQRPVYRTRRIREPFLDIPTDEQKQQIQAYLQDLTQKQAAHDRAVAQSAADQAFERWAQQDPTGLTVAEPAETLWIDEKLTARASKSGDWNYTGAARGQVQHGRFARVQDARESGGLLEHRARTNHRPIKPGPDDRWFADVWLDPDHPPRAVMLQVFSGSWNHRAYWGEDVIPAGGLGVSDAPARFYRGPLPETGGWVRLEVSARDIGIGKQPVRGMAFTQHDGLAYWDRAGVSRLPEGAVPPDLAALLARPRAERSAADADALYAWYHDRVAGDTQAVRATRKALADQKQAYEDFQNTVLHRTLITETAEPTETRILPRGDWQNTTGPVVTPGVPAFMGELATADARADRLDLANWLVSPDHPLTGRVFVNRLWKMFYGRGLSAVLDDLGSQGRWPTHPELLDWLAVEFVESGWDMKHMVRLMVSSRTYRQTSRLRPDLQTADLENHLLARQSRFRVDAEVIRDHALAVSGLLNPNMGGPPAKPYQPDGHWEHLNFPRRTYEADQDQSQYRRGLYVHWQRTFLHPMLRNFDAPSREECTAERIASNTPLQALTLLNDPTFVEAARVFAVRILNEAPDDLTQRLRWAFRAMVARHPSDDEVGVLEALYHRQHAYYTQNPGEAGALLGVGQAPGPDPALDPDQVAAWTGVARALLNLHETITRD